MYTAKQEVTRTQQQLKETKNTVTELEGAATRLRGELVKTEESLAETSKEAELAQLNERIEELAKANDTLKQDIVAAEALTRSSSGRAPTASNTGSMQTGSGNYKSGFSPSTTAAVQSASIGAETTIASISTADGIIILNASPELGLSVGSEIKLIQGLKALGKVRITKVTERLAVANILPGAKLRGLSKGDTVKVMH